MIGPTLAPTGIDPLGNWVGGYWRYTYTSMEGKGETTFQATRIDSSSVIGAQANPVGVGTLVGDPTKNAAGRTTMPGVAYWAAFPRINGTKLAPEWRVHLEPESERLFQAEYEGRTYEAGP